jgi:hypothetical protein
LGEVEELRTKEAVLKAEEQRHLDLIAASEGEVRRCDDELGEIRENQLRLLRREMDGLCDELFVVRTRKLWLLTRRTFPRTAKRKTIQKLSALGMPERDF